MSDAVCISCGGRVYGNFSVHTLDCKAVRQPDVTVTLASDDLLPPKPPATRVTCPACNGDGYVDDVGSSCPATQPCGYCNAVGLVTPAAAEAF